MDVLTEVRMDYRPFLSDPSNQNGTYSAVVEVESPYVDDGDGYQNIGLFDLRDTHRGDWTLLLIPNGVVTYRLLGIYEFTGDTTPDLTKAVERSGPTAISSTTAVSVDEVIPYLLLQVSEGSLGDLKAVMVRIV